MSATATRPRLLDGPALEELAVEHLCDFEVELEPAQLIPTAAGLRMTFITRGAKVSGPRLNGELLPGGGDWLVVGEDRVGRVDVRATLRTDDGVLVHYTAGGVIDLPGDGLERLAAGERLPFEDTYIRTTPRFETSDERYAWLSRSLVVGLNELSPDHIDYRMYRVL